MITKKHIEDLVKISELVEERFKASTDEAEAEIVIRLTTIIEELEELRAAEYDRTKKYYKTRAELKS